MKEQQISEEYLERKRRGVKWRTGIVKILGAAVFIFSIYYMYGYYENESSGLRIASAVWGALWIGGISYAALWMLIANKAFERFNEKFKSRYVMQVLQGISGFHDLSYNQKAGFSWKEVRNAAVVDCGVEKSFSSEDMLTGSYEDVGFKISDANTYEIKYSGNRSSVQQVFTGQIMCFYEFDERKESEGYLQIFRKNLLFNIKGWLGKYKIETENALFNSRFDIYSTDEHNAYYILTPQVMEKIMEFAEAVGEQTAVTFTGKKMFVAVRRSRSMFDAVEDVPVQEQTKNILEDIGILQKAKEMLVAARTQRQE